MQEQKNKKKANFSKKCVIAENKQWQQSISHSAHRLSKHKSMLIRVIQINILDERLKGLSGYDEVMWHLIPRMKKKP